MSEIRVKELRIGKGHTKQHGEEWHKTYYEVTVDTSACNDVACVEETRLYAEDLLGKWLNGTEPTTKTPTQKQIPWKPRRSVMKTSKEMGDIPDFNPELLMQHAWKGKRNPEGGHYKGSLEWGWDFSDNFPTDILEALPQTIDQYHFTLSDNKKVVNVQKAKP